MDSPLTPTLSPRTGDGVPPRRPSRVQDALNLRYGCIFYALVSGETEARLAAFRRRAHHRAALGKLDQMSEGREAGRARERGVQVRIDPGDESRNRQRAL